MFHDQHYKSSHRSNLFRTKIEQYTWNSSFEINELGPTNLPLNIYINIFNLVC